MNKIVAILFVLTLLLPTTLYAHNGGFPRLNGVEAGSYRLYAWTLPNPWLDNQDLHVSVALTQVDAATAVASAPAVETLVSDATVSASFTPPVDSGELAFTRSLTATESLGGIYYESDLRLSEPGDWRVTVNASGALGAAVAEFTVTVLPNRTLNWWLIGGGGALFVLLLVIAAVIGRRSK